MNAQPHAIALGTAHAIALATFTRSVSAKRREGKGPDRTAPHQKMSRSPSPSIVTQVTREATPEQSVTPSDAWMEEIDFEAEVPCQGPKCSNPATYVVRGHGAPMSWLVCKPCRDEPVDMRRRCTVTGRMEWTNEHFVIVEVLR